jgi:rhomboid family GlyGly-CTERM serine protease
MPFSSARRSIARWLVPLALSCLLLLMQAGGERLCALLRYDREAVLDGEWWPLFTAHFVHLGWAHCLLNLGGLALCGTLAARFRSSRAWAGALALLALGVGLLLFLASPQVTDYAGLSGVLYGLFIWALAPTTRRGDVLAWIALGVVGVRIGWQMLVASPNAQAALFDGHVVAQGHLYGAVCAIGLVVWEAVRSNRPPPM